MTPFATSRASLLRANWNSHSDPVAKRPKTEQRGGSVVLRTGRASRGLRPVEDARCSSCSASAATTRRTALVLREAANEAVVVTWLLRRRSARGAAGCGRASPFVFERANVVLRLTVEELCGIFAARRDSDGAERVWTRAFEIENARCGTKATGWKDIVIDDDVGTRADRRADRLSRRRFDDAIDAGEGGRAAIGPADSARIRRVATGRREFETRRENDWKREEETTHGNELCRRPPFRAKNSALERCLGHVRSRTCCYPRPQ